MIQRLSGIFMNQSRRRRVGQIADSGLIDLQPGEDFDSSILLHSLCVTPPAFLTQIESLTLTSLHFARHESTLYTDVLAHSIPALYICPPDPFFLQSLSSLIPVPGTETDAQPSWTYPGSQISNLMVAHVEYQELKRFISNRTEIACHIARYPEQSEKLLVFQQLTFARGRYGQPRAGFSAGEQCDMALDNIVRHCKTDARPNDLNI
ncbi:hypothetical protein BS17DRAFT_877172 [Gyrodon lividus]|nr:hypothetical protein BS17DRAFT_877172 [Gyrodon lividus]